MRRRRIALSWLVRHLLGGARNLAQGGSERRRPAADLGADAVSLIFAPAADAELHQGCRDWRQDDEEKPADRPDPTAIVPAPAAEIEAEIGEHRDGAGKRCGDGHGERVAVLDMAELMRQHARKLVAIQPLQE